MGRAQRTGHVGSTLVSEELKRIGAFYTQKKKDDNALESESSLCEWRLDRDSRVGIGYKQHQGR